MSSVSIIHNPRCSKSRQTLALLNEHGITPTIRLYLQDPLNKKELKLILQQLNLKPHQVLRKGEEAFKTLNLAIQLDNDDALINAMLNHPILLERPIVIFNEATAVIGRPPENILAHL